MHGHKKGDVVDPGLNLALGPGLFPSGGIPDPGVSVLLFPNFYDFFPPLEEHFSVGQEGGMRPPPALPPPHLPLVLSATHILAWHGFFVKCRRCGGF